MAPPTSSATSPPRARRPITVERRSIGRINRCSALLQRRLEEGNSAGSLHTARRIAKILKTVVGQLDVLETMTPRQFASFRDALGSSSGFQSEQFRELEAVLGRRAFPVSDLRDDERLQAAIARPSLFDSLLRYLAGRGHPIPQQVLDRDTTATWEPDAGVQKVLVAVYSDESGPAAEVCEALVDVDEGIQEWRYRHLKMVERTIGAKIGTGGSAGADYLRSTLFAVLLGRRGIEVTVYERRPDPRVTGAERGRSINLAISTRGLAALEQVGLRDQALKQALPMHGRMVHPRGGDPNFQPYSADGERHINSISRAELNRSLLDTAEATPGVTLVFSQRVTKVDTKAGALLLEDAEGHPNTAPADIILAGDGSYSAVRDSLRPDSTTDFLEHGYKELTVPPRNGEFALDPDALHIWPRGTSMMIALPNLDRSFTCTLFWPRSDFTALDTPDKVTAYFTKHYPDVAGLMPDLVAYGADQTVRWRQTLGNNPVTLGRVAGQCDWAAPWDQQVSSFGERTIVGVDDNVRALNRAGIGLARVRLKCTNQIQVSAGSQQVAVE